MQEAAEDLEPIALDPMVLWPIEVEAAPECIVRTDVEGRVTFANAAARSMFGLTSNDDIGGYSLALSAADAPAVVGAAGATATRDRVTGLGGRELLLDRLEHCAERCARSGERFAVMFCDLDGFKLVNDVYGHDAGDRVLAEVATRLLALVRPYDTVARFGGDEFVILVEDLDDPEIVVGIAQRIVNALAEPIPLHGQDATIGVSIGVAVSGSADESPAALLARADTAMYEAKHCGKGRVEVFGPDLDRRLTERRELARDLGVALERSELELRYRTVASLLTGDVTSLEASVRWNHAQRGWLEPDEFIPIAATTGMIERIDEFVLATAARDVASWRADHPALVAWITVSGRLFVQGNEAPRILSILAESGADPHSIGIEIGEDTVVRNFAEIASVLRDLHEGGVCIALDNFSGRLTVPQLQTLRPDAVKLDRGFVRQLGADFESAKAVRSLTGMIRPLGITIVAKGVDTPEQLGAVLALNCDEAQGAMISHPTPASDLEFERRALDAVSS